MVLRIPDTGLHLESSAKAAETLPLQAFAFTLSDNVIENLIQCVQNGEDVRLSLGNVPVSFLFYFSSVHFASVPHNWRMGNIMVAHCGWPGKHFTIGTLFAIAA